MMIGLDGATWGLLHPWISNDKLPTFKRMINSGTRGILKSTIPCRTCPALPTLYTGMNPGSTGIFSFVKPNGTPVTSRDISYPNIWNILDKYGYSSCIVNLRMTYPPEKLNGVMICGNPVPSVAESSGKYVYPEDLKERIGGFRDTRVQKKFRKYRKNTKKYRKDLLELIIKQTERRYKIFKKLNQESDYDFSIFWIGGTDTIQHHFWDDKEILLQFYLLIDNFLNDVFLSFPNRNFVIVSDHGFESCPEKFFSVNTWLYREGYLCPMSNPILHRLINFVQSLTLKYANPQWIERILQFRYKYKSNVQRLPLHGVNQKNSKAYLATFFGIDVANSNNYEKIREEIIKKLKRLEDTEGLNVLKGAWKREEIYKGKYLKQVPDIIFLASEKYWPSPILTKDVFEDIRKKIHPWFAGEHSKARDGILIASGPVFKEKYKIGDVDIEDICPTILHLMGCGIPENVDGKVLTNMFKRDSDPAKRKPLSKKYHIDKEAHKMKRKETEEMKKRLRELGYL